MHVLKKKNRGINSYNQLAEDQPEVGYFFK